MAATSELAPSAFESLSLSPVFSHVSDAHLQEIAGHSRRRSFRRGAVLMRQGDTSESMDVLVKGRAKIERVLPGKDQPVLLAKLGPGDVVGEMGVLAGIPRTATVTALDDLETLELKATFLKKLFRRDTDVLLAIMRIVSQRWQNMDEFVEMSLQVALEQLVVDEATA
ncbi:MAG TPA: cyclic nucleotide-binding domain-containing protein [Chloroflexota bacterium]|nr:cyclic nucleotide-binding domain-containing protein [Chloroflexota bacterium]